MLDKEIGQNLSKDKAPFYFGIKAKNAELVLPPILWQFFEFNTSLCMSCFMIGQQTWRNLDVKPSGLGDLSESMLSKPI
jgi:hypothetical protein